MCGKAEGGGVPTGVSNWGDMGRMSAEDRGETGRTGGDILDERVRLSGRSHTETNNRPRHEETESQHQREHLRN